MLTIERTKIITRLALPIGLALSTDLAMSLVDLAMVGRLGNHAIAAVGLSSFCNTFMLAFVGGIAPAVQGLVARRRGEGSAEPRCIPLNGGLALALIVGIPLAVICYLATPYLFPLISADPEVIRIGIPFLRTLYVGIAAAGMLRAFAGHWTGMERPKVYMAIVIFIDCLNVVLNYILIFGHFGAPALGATGAAIATVASLYTGVVVNFAFTYFRFRHDGFLAARPQASLLGRILKIGVPPTLQQFFFSAGYVVFLLLVGQVGTSELAAASVLVRISLVLLILASSLGMASATLVSKTVGQGDLGGAAQWGWDSGKLGVLGVTLLGLPLFLLPQQFLSIFLTDPHTIAIAIIPLRLVAATAGMGSLIYIFAYTLYSVGDGNRVMLISFGTQWLLFLPAVWLVGPHWHYGLLQIWLVQAGYGAIATALITAIWADGKWKRIKI